MLRRTYGRPPPVDLEELFPEHTGEEEQEALVGAGKHAEAVAPGAGEGKHAFAGFQVIGQEAAPG